MAGTGGPYIQAGCLSTSNVDYCPLTMDDFRKSYYFTKKNSNYFLCPTTINSLMVIWTSNT